MNSRGRRTQRRAEERRVRNLLRKQIEALGLGGNRNKRKRGKIKNDTEDDR